MTGEIALTLGIVAVAVILFATERVRPDVIAMLVLLTVTLTGLVSADEAFAGFASPAVITVWAVFIVSSGLFKAGIADYLGQQVLRLAGKNEARLIVVIMLTCGLMSAFMNNIGATAILLPALVGVSRQANIPVTKLLIPLSFASLMGGNMTLIGTPPNILAASLLAERGLPSFQFFDFAPMGIIVLLTGIIYMVVLGRHLLPARQTAGEQQVAILREYISEVRIATDSPLVGKSLVESQLGAEFDLTVISLTRQGGAQVVLHREVRFQSDDVLTVEGSVDNLMLARDRLRLMIEDHHPLEAQVGGTEGVHLVEAILGPRSRLVGRPLREAQLRERFGFTVLAIWRQGEVITRRLRDAVLRFGDALLLQGNDRRVGGLREAGDFLVLEPVKLEQQRRNKALFALGAMGLVLFLTTVGGFHVSTAMVIGAMVMVLTRSLSMEEAYQSIEWRSVFLIAGMLPLGLAMESTGAARYLADLMINGVGRFGPIAVLAGIYILASLITEPMSNAAATVLMVPIAIDIALGLGADPRPFVLTTVVGASTSFLTPVGHQANVLVFGTGGYKFTDFARVGAPLNVVLFVVTLIFLPLIWPLF